ncbi:Alpha-D-ribose 1-methylphosphonate 5-triphosphate synthase subunit PhnI [Campylobacter suis]|uniref:Alpha-D-ribose 1-methylphosphonate 5-triphosphate synthase subunit PhnI n=1 Tax=Campylobacter suis TaxID=2790657 RepID=A0ABM8Q985_9BACT|nr:Alpha-D-ribose 1-methylphosphonate 5-triphosphate synthase subunit PhnI [Campylobacter suis]
MRLFRRISSAFKDISGGQILGPSNDYEVKLFIKKSEWEKFSKKTNIIKSALEPLRKADMIKMLAKDDKTFDITRAHAQEPYKRSAVMQTMARGEGGSMLAFAYTSMRGYGDTHPTIGDLRLGVCDVVFTHPLTKNDVKIGEINATACESVGNFEKQSDGSMKLAVGYGFCFGFNETKSISMSILDLTLYNQKYSASTNSFVNDFEMVLAHIDGIDSMGFTNHFKLPHYVTFQADLQIFERVSGFMKGKK